MCNSSSKSHTEPFFFKARGFCCENNKQGATVKLPIFLEWRSFIMRNIDAHFVDWGMKGTKGFKGVKRGTYNCFDISKGAAKFKILGGPITTTKNKDHYR